MKLRREPGLKSSPGEWESADGAWRFYRPVDTLPDGTVVERRYWVVEPHYTRRRREAEVLDLWLRSVGLGTATTFPTRRAAIEALELALGGAPAQVLEAASV
jgi:hypothetical protein